MSNNRKFSSQVVDGYERAPSRSMLYPVGFKKEDFKKTTGWYSFDMVHGDSLQYAHK